MTDPKEIIQQTIRDVAMTLVYDEGAVSVTYQDDEQGTLFLLRVNPKDARFIVGKAGQMAHSLGLIVRSAGLKYKLDAALKLDIPDRPRESTSSD